MRLLGATVLGILFFISRAYADESTPGLGAVSAASR
jgi:hypothetical protein